MNGFGYYEQEKYDVAVIGAGAAGVAAAIAAAKNGAKTILIESTSVIGGDLLSGIPIDGAVNASGEWVVGGILKEILEELDKNGGYIGPFNDRRSLYVVMVHPGILGFVLLKKLVEYNVNILLYTQVTDVIKKGATITAVKTVNKKGINFINADLFIDCTGDGDIATASGATFDIGDTNKELMPISMVFRMRDVNPKKLLNFARNNPQNFGLGENKNLLIGKTAKDLAQELYETGMPKLFFVAEGEILKNAIEKGEIYESSMLALIPNSKDGTEIAINATRVSNINAIDTANLSFSLKSLVSQVDQCINFLVKRIPGFENAKLMGIAPRIGVRETRRIHCDYRLTTEDVMEARKREDGIAKGSHELDLHMSGVGHKRGVIKNAGSYDIPLGCMIPKGIDNVFIAGRCIDSTREALSAVRVMGTCMAMGHAVGAAAAICSKENILTRQTNIKKLRAVLKEQGAILEGTL